MTSIDTLKANLETALGAKAISITVALGEITVVVDARDYLQVLSLIHI